jgi:hypothetical protein
LVVIEDEGDGNATDHSTFKISKIKVSECPVDIIKKQDSAACTEYQ